MPDDLYPAVGASAGWTLLGLALAGAAVSWVAVVWWTTRPPRPDTAAATALEARRAAVIAELDRLTAAHRDGELTDRQLAQRVSPLVRTFVHEVTGGAVHVATLRQLESGDDRRLAELVAALYPDEFDRSPPGSSAGTLDAIRRLVADTGAP